MNETIRPEERAKILIVDDERINIRVLNALLGSDFEIMVATSGEEAIRVAGEGRPDLILLDILMPGMDGHEVCRRLKENPDTQRIPIMFITAKGEAEDETRGFELGAVDYIAKPFNFAVVMARVRTHVRLKRQSDVLERLAMCDALTGIANRRAFDEVRAQEWARCRRQAVPLSLFMIDVDHFKQYNDHYGHGAGDECLARVARALAARARRPGDIVARYGGEEFAAVLADTGLDGALSLAEELRATVEALEIPHAPAAAAPLVTVSVGVASILPSASATLEALSAAADRMLYAAKQDGRNRVAGTSCD